MTFYNILYVCTWCDWLHVVRLCYCTAACIPITFLLFYFLHLKKNILCVFMFSRLMPEIKMDWIGLDKSSSNTRQVYTATQRGKWHLLLSVCCCWRRSADGSAPFRLIPFPNPNPNPIPNPNYNPRLGAMGLGEMGGHQCWLANGHGQVQPSDIDKMMNSRRPGDGSLRKTESSVDWACGLTSYKQIQTSLMN